MVTQGRYPAAMATFDPADLTQVRAAAEAGKLALGPGPDLPAVLETELSEFDLHPGAPIVRVRLLSTTHEPDGLLIYVHGGGWVMYSIDHYDRLARHLAAETGWAVAMIDYPLAPEHQFPEPFECTREAVAWLLGDDGEAWLVNAIPPPTRRVLAGDSAGGNIASACALHGREWDVELDAQLLVYPVLDHDLDRPSYFHALFPADIERDEMRVCWTSTALTRPFGTRRRPRRCERRAWRACRRRCSSPPRGTSSTARSRPTPTACAGPASR